MHRFRNLSKGPAPFLAAALAALLSTGGAHAQTYQMLYAFTGGVGGANPQSTPLLDKAGNLYGTTYEAGQNGYGTVFRLAPNGTLTPLYAFQAGSDGQDPVAGLIADKKGNFYGTTYYGGTAGVGTVFELAANGTETVLHSFQCGNDGAFPNGGLVIRKRDIYGLTVQGGGNCGGNPCGMAFGLAPGGAETWTYDFQAGSDGQNPLDGMVKDSAGNLYGTTDAGGVNNCGGTGSCGTIFKITPNGQETVIYAFKGGSDGGHPHGTPIIDKKGNIYGTTSDGGSANYGTVYELAANGTKTVLYSFKGGSDGQQPLAGVTMGKKGVLYGTTYQGGSPGFGTVFMLDRKGTETQLHVFGGGSDGADPYGGLVRAKDGTLYGTTNIGGSNGCGGNGCGTVFKVVE